MNVRELLQYELWSKRTTLKILVGLGTLVALSLLGVWVWNEVELNWLTNGERIAAIAALKKIDDLKNAGPLNDKAYEARTTETEAAINVAEKAARTRKDDLIEMKLGMCFLGNTSEWRRVREQQLTQEGKLHHTEAERSSDQQTNLLLGELAHQSCMELHKELD